MVSDHDERVLASKVKSTLPKYVLDDAQSRHLCPYSLANGFVDWIFKDMATFANWNLQASAFIRMSMARIFPFAGAVPSRSSLGTVIGHVDHVAPPLPEKCAPTPHLATISPATERDLMYTGLRQRGVEAWLAKLISVYIRDLTRLAVNTRKDMMLDDRPLPVGGVCEECEKKESQWGEMRKLGVKHYIKEGCFTTGKTRRLRLEEHLNQRRDIKLLLATISTCSPLLLHGLGVHALMTTTSPSELKTWKADLVKLQMWPSAGTCHHNYQLDIKPSVTWLFRHWEEADLANPPEWYLGMETIFGYHPNTGAEKVEEDVSDWVRGGCVRPSLAWSMYRHLLETYRTDYDKDALSRLVMTKESLIQDPTPFFSPGVAGSVHWQWDDSTHHRIIDDKPTKTQHILSMSDKELGDAIDMPLEKMATAFVKVEPVKRRPVVNIGLGYHFTMSPLLALHVNGAQKHPNMLAYKSPLDQVSSSLLQTDDYGMPVDQAAFDHEWGVAHVLAFFASHAHLIHNVIDPSTRDFMFSRLDRLLRQPYPEAVRIGQKVFPVNGGILSGWRLTFVADTLINIASMRAQATVLETIWGAPPIQSFIAGGDDASVVTPNYTAALLTASALQLPGCQAHPQKFYIAAGRTEFFRTTIYGDGRMHGYPARLITSLTWAKPGGLAVRETFAESVESYSNDFAKLLRRLGRVGSQYHTGILAKIVAARLKIRPQVAKQLVHTPTSCGGYGFAPLLDGVGKKVTYTRSKDLARVVGKTLNAVTKLKEQFGGRLGAARAIDDLMFASQSILGRTIPRRTQYKLTDVHVPPKVGSEWLNTRLEHSTDTTFAYSRIHSPLLPSTAMAASVVHRLVDRFGGTLGLQMALDMSLIDRPSYEQLAQLSARVGYHAAIRLMSSEVLSLAVRSTQLAEIHVAQIKTALARQLRHHCVITGREDKDRANEWAFKIESSLESVNMICIKVDGKERFLYPRF